MPARKTSLKTKKAFEPTIVAPKASPRFPVVGIGASAGGLEAVTSFFKELASHLGMAYVLVLHLDPARESKLSEILARTTPIPVLQAQDGTSVEPDHIYVIPPNCEMTIDHWVLHLRDREPHRSANTTIDTFLRSLAVAHGSDAIGVILSGTASDGTLGWPRSRAKRALRLRRNRHPPNTTACRQARLPLAVSISSCPPPASLKRSPGFVITRISLIASTRRGSRSATAAIWNRSSVCCDGHDGRFFRVQIAHYRPPHSAPHGSAEDREPEGLW